MCLSSPKIPDPVPPPIIPPDDKKLELNPASKKSAKLKAGRKGTRGLQIALGGKSKTSGGLRIP